MKPTFSSYKPRIVQFHDIYRVADWLIKIHTISVKESFTKEALFPLIFDKIIQDNQESERQEMEIYNIGFLVAHEGNDAIWFIYNWWTSKEILKTKTYYVNYTSEDVINEYPLKGSMACIWEMEVIEHERSAWIEHVLKKAPDPDFQLYLTDVITKKEV